MQIFHGTIISLDKDNRVWKYLIENNGRIVYTGNTLPEMFSIDNASVIELGQGVLLPSFGDAHMHFSNWALIAVSYFDVTLKPGKQFELDMPRQNNSFLYVFEGEGRIHGQVIPLHSLVTLDLEAGPLRFSAGEQGARFVLISGKPINESVVQYGPFVMNSKEEIEQAMRDYQSNNFVKNRAVPVTLFQTNDYFQHF